MRVRIWDRSRSGTSGSSKSSHVSRQEPQSSWSVRPAPAWTARHGRSRSGRWSGRARRRGDRPGSAGRRTRARRRPRRWRACTQQRVLGGVVGRPAVRHDLDSGRPRCPLVAAHGAPWSHRLPAALRPCRRLGTVSAHARRSLAPCARAAHSSALRRRARCRRTTHRGRRRAPPSASPSRRPRRRPPSGPAADRAHVLRHPRPRPGRRDRLAGRPGRLAARLGRRRHLARDRDGARAVYDFARLDAIVDDAEAHDSDVLLVLGQTPAFHATDPTAESFYGEGASSPPDAGRLEGVRPRRGRAVRRSAGRRFRSGTRPTSRASGAAPQQQMADLTKAAYDVAGGHHAPADAGGPRTRHPPDRPARLDRRASTARSVDGTPGRRLRRRRLAAALPGRRRHAGVRRWSCSRRCAPCSPATASTSRSGTPRSTTG